MKHRTGRRFAERTGMRGSVHFFAAHSPHIEYSGSCGTFVACACQWWRAHECLPEPEVPSDSELQCSPVPPFICTLARTLQLLNGHLQFHHKGKRPLTAAEHGQQATC